MSFRPDDVDEFAHNGPTDADYILEWRFRRYQKARDDKFAASVGDWIQQLKDDSFKDVPKFCIDSVPSPTLRHVERNIPQRNYAQYFAEHARRPFKSAEFALNYGNINTLIGKPRTGMSMIEHYLASELLNIVKPVEAKADIPFKPNTLSVLIKTRLRML